MSELEEKLTEMAEYVCDQLCRFPREKDQEELDEICAKCKANDYLKEFIK